MLKSFTQTKTYTPAEVIPDETRECYSEERMQKEFKFLIEHKWSCASVDGWTVTATLKTDEHDDEFAANRLTEILDTLIPAQALLSFT